MSRAHKLLHFIKRDFHMEVAYKMKLASDLFYVFFVVVLYHYVSILIGDRSAGLLARYGCDYFSFVMVGVALANFLEAGLQGFTENVRRFMVEGSLESMFASPTPHYVLIIYSSAWPFLYATFKTALQFLVAWAVFGFSLPNLNLFSTIPSLLLSAMMFCTIGIISASVLIVVKRGDPLNWLFIQLSHIFGGILFPIDMLPKWGQILSYLFPIRYALESTRRAALSGASPAELMPDLLGLFLFTLALMPVSLFFCVFFVNRAKRSGVVSLF